MKAYKLFRIRDGKLYPLYVLATEETVMHEWLPAKAGILTEDGKVKSKLGKLAYRPGWHLADIPYCTHIGKKGPDKRLYQATDTVWCECEFADEIDYMPEAIKAGTNKKTGKVNPARCQLRYIPENGYYRYKTNPNMTGCWIISGAVKVNRILTNEEVAEICRSNGVEPQPLESEMPEKPAKKSRKKAA